MAFTCTSWASASIFADNWLRERNHTSSLSGLIISGLCLLIFSADHFIIPSMVVILLFLTLKKEKYDHTPTDHHGFSGRSSHDAHPLYPLYSLPARKTNPQVHFVFRKGTARLGLCPLGGLLSTRHPLLRPRCHSADGCRSFHHPHPCLEKKYDVVDCIGNPLLYDTHQDLTVRAILS